MPIVPRALGIVALASLLVAPAAADMQFRIRKLGARGGTPGVAQCDIRLRLGGEAEVTLRRDTVSVHTAGEAADNGSACSGIMPQHDMPEFQFTARKGAPIRLVARPSAANRYASVVAIAGAGSERCEFRLTWQVRASDLRDEELSVPGFTANNALHFEAAGRGTATTAGAPRKLSHAAVDIDRAGHVRVLIGAGSGGPLSFTGDVTAKASNQWRADVVSEDGRLRGPMEIVVDDRDRVRSITLEAGDGQQRMSLNWNRK